MPVTRLDDVADPRLADYRHVPDPELLRRGEIFVAEGRLVVRTLLTGSSCVTRSVLLTDTAFEALRDVLAPRLDELPVYVVPQGAIERLTGFNIHRGCLAIGERPAPQSIPALLAARRRARAFVVLEQVGNADNVGATFRNAAAFGVDGVVLGPGCCDPLYRKAIRTSMGAALRVPFAEAGAWPAALGLLREAGVTVVALTPDRDALPLEDFAARRGRGRPVAVLAGAEGEGLTQAALAAADVRLRIPMAAGIDSLNVATAIAIALYRLAGHPA